MRRASRVWHALIVVLLIAIVATGCGASGAAGPPGGGFGAGPRPRTPTPLPPTATARPAGAPVAASPYTVVRTYMDAQGRPVTLYHGRGVGRRGDWGWAHIEGKHLRGVWLDGGPITNFDVVGARSADAVQQIIGRTLKEDSRPDDAARGRREYRLRIPDTRYEVLAVVGNDGAIITAYPDTVRGAGG